MPTDRETAVLSLANTIGMSPSISDANEAIKAMQRRTVRITKIAADAIAADATTNGVCAGNGAPSFSIPTSLFRKGKLVGARIYPQANVTAHASNFATINITKDNGGGGSQTVILSNTTKPTANSGLGNFAAGSYVNLTPSIVAAAAVIDSGSYLQLQITKAASGVVVTAFTLELDIEEV